MQKLFCDLCDTPIINWRVLLHVTVLHTTNQDEHVGEDEFKPMDICKRCAASPMVLLELMTTKMRTYRKPEPLVEDGPGDGRAMEAPGVYLGQNTIQVEPGSEVRATARLERPLDNT